MLKEVANLEIKANNC